jgi:hypothetical protein
MSLGFEEYVRGKTAMIKDQLGANEVTYDLAGIDVIFADRALRIPSSAVSAMATLLREAEERALSKLRAEAEEQALRRVARGIVQQAAQSEPVHG